MTDPSRLSSERSLFSVAQIQHLIRVEFHRAQRYGYPLTCMLIGVDRLGHLRDLYGYESKEAIVDGVVELLKRESRASDFLGRMADDRLLAVVPHTGPEGAATLARRILAASRGLTFDSDGRSLAVTLSIGLAHMQGEELLFFDALLHGAEDGLVAAQAAGGDRFEVGAAT